MLGIDPTGGIDPYAGTVIWDKCYIYNRYDSLPLLTVVAEGPRATVFLRTMANEDRLLLLCQLTEGERCVSDLEVVTGIAQPTLSQQLSVLRSEGLVSTRRDGKFVYYALQDQRVNSMLLALHGMFCKPQVQPKRSARA